MITRRSFFKALAAGLLAPVTVRMLVPRETVWDKLAAIPSKEPRDSINDWTRMKMREDGLIRQYLAVRAREMARQTSVTRQLMPIERAA